MENTTPDLPTLAIIVPCFNEQDVITSTLAKLQEIRLACIQGGQISPSSFIACINDGSTDNTWDILKSAQQDYGSSLKLVKLSRNFGHQSALLAGLIHFENKADIFITIDADLQDNPYKIPDMLEMYHAGYQIVYGVRKDRQSDSFIKRFTAENFYKLMRWMGVDIIHNHADYRLISAYVLQQLKQFKEVNLFLRGIFPSIGFESTYIYYDRVERTAGSTKFSLTKMLSFALDGITSFSVRPLRLVTVIGFIVFSVSLVLTAFSLVAYFSHKVVPGWTSTVLPLYIISGLQILCTGIVGEYIGKIYKEVKQRPRYIIEQHIDES